MRNQTYGNVADEVVEALTHGPIPGGIQDWEILDSGYDDDQAWSVLLIDGKTFRLTVEEA